MEDDDVSSEPLSENELKAIRRIILADGRAKWLWASLRIWASWVVGAPVALYAAYAAIQKFLGIDMK